MKQISAVEMVNNYENLGVKLEALTAWAIALQAVKFPDNLLVNKSGSIAVGQIDQEHTLERKISDLETQARQQAQTDDQQTNKTVEVASTINNHEQLPKIFANVLSVFRPIKSNSSSAANLFEKRQKAKAHQKTA